MSDTTTPPRLLRTREVAERLALSFVTMYQMREASDLPSITLARARRVSEPRPCGVDGKAFKGRWEMHQSEYIVTCHFVTQRPSMREILRHRQDSNPSSTL
jgi:hypothetical protein